MNLEDCLPPKLQGPSTTIARVAAGLSGAGVYRVDADGRAFVLKISDETEPADRWRRKLQIQRLAADAGLAPPIVHTDEGRRAVISDFIVDQSFPAFFLNPATREAALALLGKTLRRLHDIPLTADADWKDPRDFLREITTGLEKNFVVPEFALDAIRWGLSTEPPAADRAEVLSHNDVNPSNLVHDGAHLFLVDWEVAGRNDPYYDLAAIAVFLRLDADTCRRLIEIHDGAPVGGLTPRFLYVRRMVATLLGAMGLMMARTGGHPGAKAGETLETAPSLADFYQAMRTGQLSLTTGDGKIAFALALIKASVEF